MSDTDWTSATEAIGPLDDASITESYWPSAPEDVDIWAHASTPSIDGWLEEDTITEHMPTPTTTSTIKSLRPQTKKFFDLPAEIRNPIYEAALRHDRFGGTVAAAGLLATCKQANEEAKNILYDKSTFGIKISTRKYQVIHRTGRYGLTSEEKMEVSVAGDIEFTVDGTDYGVTALTTVANIWPPAAQKVPNATLVLDVDLEETIGGNGWSHLKVVQRLLYGLVSCMKEGGKVQNVKVLWASEDPQPQLRLQWLLYPLAKLPSNFALHIVSPAYGIKRHLTKLQSGAAVQCNQLSEIQRLPATLSTTLKHKFINLPQDDQARVEKITAMFELAKQERSVTALLDHRMLVLMSAVQALDMLPAGSNGSAVQAVYETWQDQWSSG